MPTLAPAATSDLVPADHPARFPRKVLALLGELLEAEVVRRRRLGLPEFMRVLDPFAGTGRVHELATTGGLWSSGIDLQKRYACWHPATMVGNALHLPYRPHSFQAVVSSPCYANRMADGHKAKDACKPCRGRGYTTDAGAAVPAYAAGARPCKACKGSGLSRRNTYRHRHGEEGWRTHPDNAATMQWGTPYRLMHADAMRALLPHTPGRPGQPGGPLEPGGLILWDVKSHFRTMRKGDPPVYMPVAEWHLQTWMAYGCQLLGAVPVAPGGLPDGANYSTRAESELVLVLRAPGGATEPEGKLL